MRFEGPTTKLDGSPLPNAAAIWCWSLYYPDPSFTEINRERAFAMMRLHGVKQISDPFDFAICE